LSDVARHGGRAGEKGLKIKPRIPESLVYFCLKEREELGI
jgi:hypothetical protein